MAKKSSQKGSKGGPPSKGGMKQQFSGGVPLSRRPPRQPGR